MAAADPAVPPPAHTQAGRVFFALKRRPRLLICAALALAVYFAAPANFREATRALIAWNVGAWLFLGMIFAMMVRAPRSSLRAHAADEDESAWALLVIAVVAASAALAAIVWELGPVKDMTGLRKGEHIALVAATVLSAWAFIHVMFALHYAAEYYADGEGAAPRGGLTFPQETAPGWGEFMYQGFVIGCACATADVNTTTTSMRVACLAQGVVAFIFNTVILALTINIGAGFI